MRFFLDISNCRFDTHTTLKRLNYTKNTQRASILISNRSRKSLSSTENPYKERSYHRRSYLQKYYKTSPAFPFIFIQKRTQLEGFITRIETCIYVQINIFCNIQRLVRKKFE